MPHGPALDFRQGDMRELPWPDESFDAVLNLWTAFGYFETRAEDERVLDEIARVLGRAAVLVLDTVNQAAHSSPAPRRGAGATSRTRAAQEHREYDVVTGRVAGVLDVPARRGARASWPSTTASTARPNTSISCGEPDSSRLGSAAAADGSELARDSWQQIVIAERR